MMYNCVALLTFLLFGLARADSEKPNDTEIVLVHVIFRHGERTTFRFYPNDPNKNETFYPVGLSGLTNNGKLMMFKLGEILREKYGHLLGEDYIEDKLYVRSTGTARTTMSAMLVLAGLWPPGEKQKWNPSLAWQPIPVFSKPFHEEDLLDSAYCKRRSKILDNLPTNTTVQELLFKPNKQLFSYIEEHSGLVVKDFRDLIEFYFILKAEDDYGLQLPEWTKSIYPEPLQSTASLVYQYMNFVPAVQKIQSGYLLQKILDDSVAKVNGKLKPTDRTMFLYSGHEATLANLLYTLKVFKQPHVPPYGSAVIVELHKRDKDHYLQLKYLRYPFAPNIQVLTLPDCDTLCPVHRFVELQSAIFPTVSSQKACSIDEEVPESK